MKKVLIVSMTCGQGHNAVSKAISENLLRHGFEVKIIQLFSYSEKREKFENWQYLFACKYLRIPYSIGWEITNRKNPNKRDSLLIHKTVKKTFDNLKKQIDDFLPDVIITTHPYSNVAISDMKKNGIIKNIKTVSVLTDYCVHPFWEAAIEMDYVITPCSDTTDELIYRGYSKNQIKVMGLVVDDKFKKIIKKVDARKILGIDDIFTILIISGGNGIGNSVKLVKNLLKSRKTFQILCICGKNQKSKSKLEKFVEKSNIKNVKIYGFVNNVEVLMNSADCIFSRGGAISITEALNLNVPIIIREKMIINEKRNKLFLLKNKSAFAIEKIGESAKLIDRLIGEPNLLEKIKENQKKITNQNAGEEIAIFIKKIVG